MSNQQYHQHVIATIIETNKISGFLASEGIHPEREYYDKYMYMCPLPNHNEIKPSFVVYENENEGQSFYCFGCKAYGNIISLYSKLNGISWRESIKHFANELDNSITIDDGCTYQINKLYKEHERDQYLEGARDIFGMLSLKISNQGFNYLVKTQYDDNEFAFLEKLYQKIDACIQDEDIITLDEIYNTIVEEQLFPVRYDHWMKQKQEQLKCSIKEGEEYGAIGE